MNTWLRKLRAVVRNGLVWAGAWICGTLAFTVFPIVVWGMPMTPGLVVAMVLNGAVIGFATGAVFSTVLGVAYRNRLLADIRGASIGVLGASAGMFLPVGFWALTIAAGNPFPAFAALPSILMSGGIGWATAVGSLRLAKSVDPDALETGQRPRLGPVPE